MTSDTRQTILAAALNAFADAGYDATTVAEIRIRAKVSNGSFFHFFKTKEALAEALYVESLQDYHAGVLRVLAAHPDHAEAAVRGMVEHHLAWVETSPVRARFLFERGRPDWGPARGSNMREANASIEAAVEAWAEPLERSGRLKPFPPLVRSACVIGPAQMACRAWIAGLTDKRPTELSQVLGDAAWAAVRPGAQEGEV